jgi:D-alanyl-D-alanine carboxypeptidase
VDTYTLIKRDGPRVKIPYILNNNSEYVTEHFSRAELDTGHDPDALFFQPTLQLLEAARVQIGPIHGNSGYRSYERQVLVYQEDIKNNSGIPSGKVARPGHSPHETGAAADLAVPNGYTAESFAKLLRNISADLGFPMARTGWKEYFGNELCSCRFGFFAV